MSYVQRLAAATLLLFLAHAPAHAPAQDTGLRYFGYFAARITASGGNHLGEVASRSNLNWVQISDPDRYAPEVLDGCAPKGCVVSTGHEFFTGCDAVHSPTCKLHPDYVARWGRLAEAVRSRIDKVGAFYLMDEPQYRGASPQELEQVARTIKATYPEIPVMMVEASPQVSGSLVVPASVGWVGFDLYCEPITNVEQKLATLRTRISASQSLFLVPEAAPLEACGGSAGHATDAEIAALQYEYLRLAQSEPRVIGLLAFGFWTSGYDSSELPRTVAAHEDIFSRVSPPEPPPLPPAAPAAVEILNEKAKVSRRGAFAVKLSCPAQSACAGQLTATRVRGRGKPIATGAFEISAGGKGSVRTRIAARARRRVLRSSRRPRGEKLSIAAATPAGTTTGTLTIRRRGTSG